MKLNAGLIDSETKSTSSTISGFGVAKGRKKNTEKGERKQQKKNSEVYAII